MLLQNLKQKEKVRMNAEELREKKREGKCAFLLSIASKKYVKSLFISKN